MIKKIKEIQKNKDLVEKVKKRIEEFEKVGSSSDYRWFQELCFCLLTANYSAKRALKAWVGIKGIIKNASKEEISKKLRKEGYQYYNKRAEYIVEARKFLSYSKSFKELVRENGRNWLLNIKGVGMKESSHFLRNIGYKDYAILDRHVLRVLFENRVIDNIPKNLKKKQYLEIEKKLKEIAKAHGISIASL